MWAANSQRAKRGAAKNLNCRRLGLSARLLGLGSLCSCLAFLPISQGKLKDGSLRLGGVSQEDKFRYVTKFSYRDGGSYGLKAKLVYPETEEGPDVVLDLGAFTSENWHRAQTMHDPCERPRLARHGHQVSSKTDGTWSESVTGSVARGARPETWYFALSACGGVLQNSSRRFEFEFRAAQADGSQFTEETRWMLPLHMIWLLVSIVFAFLFVGGTMRFGRAVGSVHPVIWMLASAMLLQFIAQVLHTIHLFMYSIDGAGLKEMEIMSELLLALGQLLQTILLIVIGFGYTLLQAELGDLDLVIPVAFLVAIIQILLVGFGKLEDDQEHKFHEHAGPLGLAALAMRLALYAVFLLAVRSSWAKSSMGLRRFYGKFRAASSLYFLMYPGTFLATKCVTARWQHSVMAGGLMLMQMGANIWLAMLFLTRGEYYAVSTLSDSELPSGSIAKGE